MGCMQSPRPTLTVDLCTSLSHVEVDLVRERGNPWDSTSSQGDHDLRSYLSVPPLGCPRIVGADLLLKLYRRPQRKDAREEAREEARDEDEPNAKRVCVRILAGAPF